MADRSVILRFLSDTTGLKRGFAEVGQGAQESEGVFAKLEGKLSGVGASGVAAAAGMAGVATSVVAFATEAVKRLGDEQVAAAQTAAAILSTGGAAQVSAVHVHTLAESLGKMSGVDHEVVQSGENLLLTFDKVVNGVGAGNDVFDQATKAALNVSVALGEDMTAASTQVGKALQDPVAGLTALHRVGVVFTDDQKKAIQAFVASGDVMSAQKIILAELNHEFGGSAEAYGKTLPGAIGKAKTAIADWSADMATKAMPAVQTLIGSIGDLATAVGPTLAASLTKVGGVLVDVGKFFKDHAGLVVATAAVYAATLVPALVTSVKAFINVNKAGVLLGLAVQKLREMAEAGKLVNASLMAVGTAGLVVELGAIVQGFINAKSQAKAYYDELDKHHDLGSISGVTADLADTYAHVADAQNKLGTIYKNPVKAFGEALWETLTPAKNTILDYSAAIDQGNAHAAELETTLAGMRQIVGDVAKAFGISTTAVEEYAKANNIDLTGSVPETTQKLEDQYRATLEATKGWTGYGVSVEDAVQLQKDITAAFEAATDPVKVFTAALAGVNDAAKASGKAQADSIRGQAQATRDALDARHAADTAALAGEFITGKASQAAHDQRVTDLEATQAAENKAADATVASEGRRADAIENTAAKTTLTMGEYQKAVDANTKSVTTWMTNLALIGSRDPLHGSQLLEGQLAQLGPAQAGLVAQVLKSSGPAFDSFVTTMAKAGKTATDEAALELDKLPGEVQTIAQTSGQTFATTLIQEVATGIVPLSALVAQATKDAIAAGVAAAAGTPTRGPSGPAGIVSTPGGDVVTYTPPPAGPPVPVARGVSGPAGLHAAEGHYAQVAPAGSWRVWAEPETGGEAYIPLGPSKRAGSMGLLSRVATAFGQRVVPMAAGGISPDGPGGINPDGTPRLHNAGIVSSHSVDTGGGLAGLAKSVAALEQAVTALQSSSGKRSGPVNVQNTFNEKVDPLHVGRQILRSLSG